MNIKEQLTLWRMQANDLRAQIFSAPFGSAVYKEASRQLEAVTAKILETNKTPI